ncbi:hypothetical protein [Nonomuraea typhae]|uniref:hypothetical protein n=1 Tax=Nonomuraea typhae TaxID=2603600 RepID=UPI0012FA7CB8|nr:hypothetical protein [Nonomuraea typhae]
MAELVEEVGSGDRRRALKALRDKLAAELSGSEGRTSAALAKELVAVLRELDSLPLPKEASSVDDLAAKRAARRAGASGLDGSTSVQ